MKFNFKPKHKCFYEKPVFVFLKFKIQLFHYKFRSIGI